MIFRCSSKTSDLSSRPMTCRRICRPWISSSRAKWRAACRGPKSTFTSAKPTMRPVSCTAIGMGHEVPTTTRPWWCRTVWYLKNSLWIWTCTRRNCLTMLRSCALTPSSDSTINWLRFQLKANPILSRATCLMRRRAKKNVKKRSLITICRAASSSRTGLPRAPSKNERIKLIIIFI